MTSRTIIIWSLGLDSPSPPPLIQCCVVQHGFTLFRLSITPSCNSFNPFNTCREAPPPKDSQIEVCQRVNQRVKRLVQPTRRYIRDIVFSLSLSLADVMLYHARPGLSPARFLFLRPSLDSAGVFKMANGETNGGDYEYLIQSEDPEHPANLIPELCRKFYRWGWVSGPTFPPG